MARFVTGDGVAIDRQVARVPSRTLAVLVDTALAALLTVLLTLGLRRAAGDSATAAAAAVLVLVFVTIGYPLASERLTGGRSAGKALLGLRVVRADGGPVRFRHSLVRALVGAFLDRPGLSLGLLAVLPSLASEQGQRLGDVLAGTLVVHDRRVSAPPLPPAPPDVAAWAAGADLTGVRDEHTALGRQFVTRAATLTPAVRESLGRALLASTLATVTPPPPPGAPGWAVLTAVIDARSRAGAEPDRRTGGGPAPGAVGTPFRAG